MKICANSDCQKTLPSKYPNRKFCSRQCKNASYHRNDKKSDLPTGTTGAISELKICVDLMRKKYNVFRAQSPNCPCDLIGMKDGEILRIEVKTILRRTHHKYYIPANLNLDHFDILAIILGDEIIYKTVVEVRSEYLIRNLPSHSR